MKSGEMNAIIKEGKEIVQNVSNDGLQKESMTSYEWLSYVGMRMYYDPKYKDLIKKAFLSANIYQTDEELHKFLMEKFDHVSSEFLENTFARGLSIKTFQKKKNKIQIQSDIVISTFACPNPFFLLEGYVHELNHILNSLNNSVIQKNAIYSRVGLELVKQDGKDIGSGMEEAFNTLQTESILNSLSTLPKSFIKDQEFLKYYKEVILNSKMTQITSYTKLTS